MSDSFRVFFNHNRQFFEVYLHDVHPNTFSRKGGGRWGYFIRTGSSNPRRGKFGEIHLVKSRVRHDSVSHELDHLRMKWLFSKWIIVTPNNEEWFCTIGDELTRKFWNEYERYKRNDVNQQPDHRCPKTGKHR
jgi:hypothetical protein